MKCLFEAVTVGFEPTGHVFHDTSEINFPGASTQTPQGRLPPASQERGISPNLATLGASLYAPRGGECTHSHSSLCRYNQISIRHHKRKAEQSKSILFRTHPLASESQTLWVYFANNRRVVLCYSP